MGKTLWSIASPIFALGGKQYQSEIKIPISHLDKIWAYARLPGSMTCASTAIPALLVCAVGLQLRQAVPRKFSPHMSAEECQGEPGVCASSILVSDFKHCLSMAPGEQGGSMCLSGTQQP